jgi:hypothetical protein
MTLRKASRALAAVACGALALLAVQCSAPAPAPAAPSPPPAPAAVAAPAASVAPQADPVAQAKDAWPIIYAVLQHPRCANCHPAGDRPLVGDDSQPHPQNVQRGPGGHGVAAMRCDTCHQTSNLDGPHLPPGAPNWHLPTPGQPLVFVGKSSQELCEQLRDPARNGGKTPEQLFEHMNSDPLVLWGWDPGPGREPVSTSHEKLVWALKVWIDGGCGCPGE